MGGPPRPSTGRFGVTERWSTCGACEVLRTSCRPGTSARSQPARCRWIGPRSTSSSADGPSRFAEAGLDPFDLLDRMATAVRSLLDGKTLDVNELRDALLRRVRSLSRITRPKEARHDMPEPLYRALGLTGQACIVEGRGTDSVMARTDQWLKTRPPTANPTTARAELARRFLHCYGPATPERFAEWTGLSPKDARAVFELIEDELGEIDLGAKQRGRLLASDTKALESPPSPSGVRLLPMRDPYLHQRDRATVVPDASAREKVWQSVSGPGAVLVGGEIVGTWRSRLDRARLQVQVETFGRPTRAVRSDIEAEAELVALVRGIDAAEVTLSRDGR